MSVPFLPQEIIHQILSNLPTKFLCTLLSTSKSIYLDVTGILHSRLESDLLNKGDHKLIVIHIKAKSNDSSKHFFHVIKEQFPTIYQHILIRHPNPTPSLP